MNGFTFLILAITLVSCNNMKRGDQDLVSKFDSINKVLTQTQTRVTLETDSVYRAMIDRLPGEQGGMRQFYYHVQDFYGYVSNLRWQFYKASGDTAGERIQPGQETNRELTNRFFEAQNDTTLKAISAYENATLGDMQTSKEFNAVYFRDTEPQTVVLILNSLEQQVRIFELQILNKYFNNYINERKEKILGDRNSYRDTLPQ